ncbi:hypothetical protein [Streptomyces sp. NPDC002133]|uniref:hypothetical protein n=1 Tax=Streptomyces sp. NPDC002133 TaxID=3154409 RepID=UPI0033283769
MRDEDDPAFVRMTAKEIGDVTLLARITDHDQGLATPALYGIAVTTILSATVDEPGRFARRITHLRSYLGAYTGAFRAGDTVHVAGKLVHLHNGDHADALRVAPVGKQRVGAARVPGHGSDRFRGTDTCASIPRRLAR